MLSKRTVFYLNVSEFTFESQLMKNICYYVVMENIATLQLCTFIGFCCVFLSSELDCVNIKNTMTQWRPAYYYIDIYILDTEGLE